ncbi:hypothetical protein P606_13520 [Comamonas thiooxydans]|nr:hypothetical protein P606_13520 [Comamonas thiooxydans]
MKFPLQKVLHGIFSLNLMPRSQKPNRSQTLTLTQVKPAVVTPDPIPSQVASECLQVLASGPEPTLLESSTTRKKTWKHKQQFQQYRFLMKMRHQIIQGK